jgi:hypothetical protein
MNKGEKEIKRIQKLYDDTAFDMLMRDVELANPLNAIPLEQIKGDIARRGHRIDRIIALDPEAGRLFFQDHQNNHLFAEFSDGSQGFSLRRIGFQHEVQKEYDSQDLQPDPMMKRQTYDVTELDAEPRDRVINRHDEHPADESIGARPQGNPNTYAEAKPDMTADKDAPEHDRDTKWPTIDEDLYKLTKILYKEDDEVEDDEYTEKIGPLAAAGLGAAAGSVLDSKDKKK